MRHRIFFILFIFLSSVPAAHASGNYIRAQGKPLQGQLREWSVTFEPDLVLIANEKAKTNCKIDVDNVIGAFWLQKSVLVFESGDSVEDYLSFVDGLKCKLLKKVDLGSEQLRRKRLKSLQLSDK